MEIEYEVVTDVAEESSIAGDTDQQSLTPSVEPTLDNQKSSVTSTKLTEDNSTR